MVCCSICERWIVSERDAVRDSLKHTELQYHSDSPVSLTLFQSDGKRESERSGVGAHQEAF